VENTQSVVVRPEVTNRISLVPTPRAPHASEQASVAPSLVPVALMAGGYSVLVAAVTAVLCVVGG